MQQSKTVRQVLMLIRHLQHCLQFQLIHLSGLTGITEAGAMVSVVMTDPAGAVNTFETAADATRRVEYLCR